MRVAVRRTSDPIQQDVRPGAAAQMTVGVAAVRQAGEPLPEGDYDIRFEMVRLADDKWFSSLGDEGLSVPIRIGKPDEQRAAYLSIEGPVMMRTATDYLFKVRVRNDGSATWKAGAAAIGCGLFRLSSYLHGGPGDSEDEVKITPIRANLLKEWPLGRPPRFRSQSISRMRPGSRFRPGSNRSRGPISSGLTSGVGAQWISAAGARTRGTIVDVFESDCGASILAADLPGLLDAGKTYDIKLAVKNNGPEPWTPQKHSFGNIGIPGRHRSRVGWGEDAYQVLDQAGRACDRDGKAHRAALRRPVYPRLGPCGEGRMGVNYGDLAGGRPARSGGDGSARGRLVFADLSKLFDTVGTSPDRNRESGNFDGTGLSFPAEFVPPDAGIGKLNDIYPCGYLWTAQGSGLESSRRISFRYGGKVAGRRTPSHAPGQSVPVPKGKYSRLHVLGAAIEQDQEAAFGLGYEASAEPAKIVMSSWTAEAAHGEDAAFVALHRHSASGDERGARCFLFHYTIPVDPSPPLTSVVLPKNDKVRVVAITLEKQ